MMIVSRDLPVGSGKAVYSKNDLSSKEITPATIPPVIHFTTNSSRSSREISALVARLSSDMA